jgi:hypothetical protein
VPLTTVPTSQIGFTVQSWGAVASCCWSAVRADGGTTIGAFTNAVLSASNGTATATVGGTAGTTTVAPTTTLPAVTFPQSTTTAILVATLRIPGAGFAEILLGNNGTVITILFIAVRRDIARRLRIVETAIIIRSLTVGSLVANFSVTADANITASNASATLQSQPADSLWLSDTQAVYSAYTTAGAQGEILSAGTVDIESVTDAPTTVVAVSTTPVPPNVPQSPPSASLSGCKAACIGFAIAAAAAGIFVIAAITIYCCCLRGRSVALPKAPGDRQNAPEAVQHDEPQNPIPSHGDWHQSGLRHADY